MALSLHKSEIEDRMRLKSGLGTSDRDKQIVEVCVRDGYERFLHCGVHNWSFSKQWHSLPLASGDTASLVPEDLGGIEGNILIKESTDAYASDIPLVQPAAVESALLDYPDITGRPEMAALRPVRGKDSELGQRQELVVYPIADASYILRFEYYVPDKLTDQFPYCMGGPEHRQTIIAAALMVWEETFLSQPNGPHAQAFEKLLQRSIMMDSRKKPQQLGVTDADMGYTRPIVYHNGIEIGE